MHFAISNRWSKIALDHPTLFHIPWILSSCDSHQDAILAVVDTCTCSSCSSQDVCLPVEPSLLAASGYLFNGLLFSVPVFLLCRTWRRWNSFSSSWLTRNGELYVRVCVFCNFLAPVEGGREGGYGEREGGRLRREREGGRVLAVSYMSTNCSTRCGLTVR